MNMHNTLQLVTALCGFVVLHLCVEAKAKLEHYTTLGVSEKASQQEIKQAFRNLALQYHPDKNKNPDAADKFQKIAKAYSVLNDPDKRKRYDSMGQFGDYGDQSLPTVDISSFFKQFDEALKAASRKQPGDTNSESFKSGTSGGFFDFENMFSDTGNNLFATFGKPGGNKDAKKKKPSSNPFAGLEDLLKLLNKPKGAPTEQDQNREQNQDTDQNNPKKTNKGVEDILKLLNKPKGAPTEQDQNREQNQDTDENNPKKTNKGLEDLLKLLNKPKGAPTEQDQNLEQNQDTDENNPKKTNKGLEDLLKLLNKPKGAPAEQDQNREQNQDTDENNPKKTNKGLEDLLKLLNKPKGAPTEQDHNREQNQDTDENNPKKTNKKDRIEL